LKRTSAAFLVASSPIKAANPVPFQLPSRIAAPPAVPERLLTLVPENVWEERLQETLIEFIRIATEQYKMLVSMQAGLVLQNIYCERLRGQLFAKEKAKNTPKGSGKLAVDGLPRCLTSDEFVQRVQAFVEHQLEEAAQKEQRRSAREEYSKAMKEWTRIDKLRIESNKLLTAKYKADVALWEAERDLAKTMKRRPRWNKPKKGKQPGPVPKPKKPTEASEAVPDEEEQE
ncbi:hypothetical protein SCHPADRAFT_789401, partial [Schizopora paradoxa]